MEVSLERACKFLAFQTIILFSNPITVFHETLGGNLSQTAKWLPKQNKLPKCNEPISKTTFVSAEELGLEMMGYTDQPSQ